MIFSPMIFSPVPATLHIRDFRIRVTQLELCPDRDINVTRESALSGLSHGPADAAARARFRNFQNSCRLETQATQSECRSPVVGPPPPKSMALIAGMMARRGGPAFRRGAPSPSPPDTVDTGSRAHWAQPEPGLRVGGWRMPVRPAGGRTGPVGHSDNLMMRLKF